VPQLRPRVQSSLFDDLGQLRAEVFSEVLMVGNRSASGLRGLGAGLPICRGATPEIV